MRILIAVTHLLGVGHLTRASALADAFAASGHRVLLVSGGRPQPHHMPGKAVETAQLPPVYADGADFVNLRGEDGEPAAPDTFASRAEKLVSAAEGFAPDCIITETFPFGRNALRLEYDALLQWAERAVPRPVLLASVRDILNPPSRPEKALRAEGRIVEHYDGVLVHGDADDIPLSASWPVTPRLEPYLAYTGHVLKQRETANVPAASGDIIVSGGGGAAGLPLFDAALAAAAASPDREWHVLVGAGVDAAGMQRLRDAAPPNALVERARPDFPALLAAARLSISQAGYNTAADLAAAGTPSVLVPFEAGGEKEQRLRADALAARGVAVVLAVSALSGPTLLTAVRAAAGLQRRAPRPAPGGARQAVTVAQACLARRDAADAGFAEFEETLDGMRARGSTAEFWWRDDDAAEDTPELRRLLRLRARHDVPLALAASPMLVKPELPRLLRAEAGIDVLMHGLEHRNNAPANSKKQELGYRDLSGLLPELRDGLARHMETFGPMALPVMVPPWNRIQDDIIELLYPSGFTGLSTFGKRAGQVVSRLVVNNTHIDPVNWRGGKRLVDEASALARLGSLLEGGEPIGLLTHHLVHDGATWRFIDRLLGVLARHPAVRFRAAHSLWSTR